MFPSWRARYLKTAYGTCWRAGVARILRESRAGTITFFILQKNGIRRRFRILACIPLRTGIFGSAKSWRKKHGQSSCFGKTTLNSRAGSGELMPVLRKSDVDRKTLPSFSGCLAITSASLRKVDCPHCEKHTTLGKIFWIWQTDSGPLTKPSAF